MIWRLTYCNKNGVEARVDIIKGGSTSVEIVEGSANPFTLSYKLDKNDKSGHIMTSSADIEIFETATFNIDDLKTSNETELKVEYFEDNVLTWSGFILPDFFSREIGSPNIVRMTASDRLTALKGVTLSDLPARISLRDLIELSLAQTGLSLALVAQIQINQGSTNILDAEILSQRLTDVRGRSISCYDILMSIMVATNSTIRQRAGQWVVYNKLEHEQRTPTIFFDKVERGAIRTIQPVASSVGVYQEFGGGRLHPDNYDFSQGLVNWSSINGFVAEVENRSIDGYTLVQVPTIFMQPIYGEVTTKNTIRNINTTPGFDPNYDNVPYLKSDDIPIVSVSEDSVDINFNISAIGPHNAALRYVVLATKGSTRLYLNGAGTFETFNPTNEEHVSLLSFGQPGINVASVKSKSIKGTLNNPTGYSISIRIYGSGTGNPVFINFVSISFANAQDVPKGSIYKTEQGSNFTKLHDVETTIFGDYITSGLNGYFYNYPIDDTSNLYLPSGELSSPRWITAFDTTGRPLLHHITRQKSRLFSIAHDILRANINVESFDPLAVFQDCKGGKYVVVSASFDFLRSEADVELEQIAYDNTILKRDFIYSYFGEGESNIKSIGGIAGGGGGTGGGGMTSEQLEILNDVAELAHSHENKEIIDQITQDMVDNAHSHKNKEIIDQITQDMVDNASREIVTSTDTETELTDENILSALRVLSEIAKNNVTFLEELKNQFLSKINPDTAQKLIKFVEGIEVGTFTTGALGSGAAIKMIDGTSYAEVDNLIVRQKATFRELIIEALKHIGGQLVLTPARMKCVRVVDGGSFYKCYFDTGDGEVSNEFVAGDFARCQVFTGSGTKFYWRLVTSVGEDWINLSKTSAAEGSDAPEAGDDIVQLGNATDTTRQSAIILSTVGADAPSWKQYSGINSFSLEGKETTVFSKLGNRIQGNTVLTSGGTNLDDHLDGVAQDILDALQAAQDAEDKAQQAIEDAEANVGLINTEIGKLQAQIDGEVSNWFYPYSPTLANYPASDWTTNEIKDRHIGDTFTNTQTFVDNATTPDAGKSWRFVKNGSTYSWTVIADSDAVKALLEASKAQATADGKSTTFLIQPTSYKLGDMWVLNADRTINGTAYKQGEILTATQDSETFNEAHWLKRIRYTDDTAVNNLEIGGRNLALNSMFSVVPQGWTAGQSTTVSNGVVTFRSNADIRAVVFLNISIDLIPQERYLISFWYKIQGEAYSYIAFNRPDATWQNQQNISYTTDLYIPDNQWHYLEIPVVKDSFMNHKRLSIGFQTDANIEMSVKEVKLEKGNKATDWTPAPEDIQYDYEAKIENAGDSISLAVYNKTLDELNPATELKLTSSSIKLTVADDIATAKSQAISAAATDATTKANNAKNEAISAAATDATNKVNGLKADLSGTGIDIEAGILTLYSGAKGGNAGGKIIIAGDNFSVDANGKLKAVDGEFSGKITANEGTLGALTMQSGGYIDLPPSFTNRKGRLDNTGLSLIYDGANSQKIEWYSGLGTFAGQITCNSQGRLRLSSSFGIEMSVDFLSYSPISITGSGLYHMVDFGTAEVANIRKLSTIGQLNMAYTTHALSAQTNYHISTDATLIVITSAGSGTGIYRITNPGNSSPSDGDVKIIMNTSSTNYCILKSDVTNSNIKVLLNSGPWFRILQDSIVVLVYYNGYWRIQTDWGQPG